MLTPVELTESQIEALRERAKSLAVSREQLAAVGVVKAVHEHPGLTLAEANGLVDRCVFGGETVTISGLSDLDANALVARLRPLPDAPPIDVEVE